MEAGLDSSDASTVEVGDSSDAGSQASRPPEGKSRPLGFFEVEDRPARAVVPGQ